MSLFKKVVSVAAAVSAIGMSAASAAPVQNVLFPGFQQLSDNSAESLIDMGGSTPGVVDVGDRLRGIFTIETVEKSPNPTRLLGQGSGNNELSGLFDVTVLSKVNLGAGGFAFTFGPSAAFTAVYGAGAMVAFYQDPLAQYSRVTSGGCTSAAIGGNCETNITNGSLFWVAGMNGGANEFWTANAITDNIGAIGSIPAPGNGGQFNISLDLLTNNSGLKLQTVACGIGSQVGSTIEFCGSGSLLGTGGVSTPYSSFDNVDFAINVVPEPETLALFGIAALGLGFSARRRKQA